MLPNEPDPEQLPAITEDMEREMFKRLVSARNLASRVGKRQAEGIMPDRPRHPPMSAAEKKARKVQRQARRIQQRKARHGRQHK